MLGLIPVEVWLLLAGVISSGITYLLGLRTANTKRDRDELRRAKEVQDEMDEVTRPVDESDADNRLRERLSRRR